MKLFTFVIAALLLVVAGAFGYSRIRFEKQIQQSDNPREIVDAFLQALMTNNLRFAKELVTPEQSELIDQWKVETNHQSRSCPANWNFEDLSEPFAWGVGGSATINDSTIVVDSSYGCSNNDYSIRIEQATVRYDGKNWRIAHWDRICESSNAEHVSRICFPKD